MEAKLSDWIQTGTAIAVLAGLGLVIYELQQTRDLTRAQLFSEQTTDALAARQATLSETFASVRTKACFTPDELTDAELYEMYEFHSLLVLGVSREVVVKEIAGWDYDWEELAKASIGIYLSTKAGRADYEATKDISIIPAVRQLAEDMIANGEVEKCEDLMGRYFNLARSKEDPRY